MSAAAQLAFLLIILGSGGACPMDSCYPLPGWDTYSTSPAWGTASCLLPLVLDNTTPSWQPGPAQGSYLDLTGSGIAALVWGTTLPAGPERLSITLQTQLCPDTSGPLMFSSTNSSPPEDSEPVGSTCESECSAWCNVSACAAHCCSSLEVSQDSQQACINCGINCANECSSCISSCFLAVSHAEESSEESSALGSGQPHTQDFLASLLFIDSKGLEQLQEGLQPEGWLKSALLSGSAEAACNRTWGCAALPVTLWLAEADLCTWQDVNISLGDFNGTVLLVIQAAWVHTPLTAAISNLRLQCGDGEVPSPDAPSPSPPLLPSPPQLPSPPFPHPSLPSQPEAPPPTPPVGNCQISDVCDGAMDTASSNGTWGACVSSLKHMTTSTGFTPFYLRPADILEEGDIPAQSGTPPSQLSKVAALELKGPGAAALLWGPHFVTSTAEVLTFQRYLCAENYTGADVFNIPEALAMSAAATATCNNGCFPTCNSCSTQCCANGGSGCDDACMLVCTQSCFSCLAACISVTVSVQTARIDLWAVSSDPLVAMAQMQRTIFSSNDSDLCPGANTGGEFPPSALPGLIAPLTQQVSCSLSLLTPGQMATGNSSDLSPPSCKWITESWSLGQLVGRHVMLAVRALDTRSPGTLPLSLAIDNIHVGCPAPPPPSPPPPSPTPPSPPSPPAPPSPPQGCFPDMCGGAFSFPPTPPPVEALAPPFKLFMGSPSPAPFFPPSSPLDQSPPPTLSTPILGNTVPAVLAQCVRSIGQTVTGNGLAGFQLSRYNSSVPIGPGLLGLPLPPGGGGEQAVTMARLAGPGAAVLTWTKFISSPQEVLTFNWWACTSNTSYTGNGNSSMSFVAAQAAQQAHATDCSAQCSDPCGASCSTDCCSAGTCAPQCITDCLTHCSACLVLCNSKLPALQAVRIDLYALPPGASTWGQLELETVLMQANPCAPADGCRVTLVETDALVARAAASRLPLCAWHQVSVSLSEFAASTVTLVVRSLDMRGVGITPLQVALDSITSSCITPLLPPPHRPRCPHPSPLSRRRRLFSHAPVRHSAVHRGSADTTALVHRPTSTKVGSNTEDSRRDKNGAGPSRALTGSSTTTNSGNTPPNRPVHQQHRAGDIRAKDGDRGVDTSAGQIQHAQHTQKTAAGKGKPASNRQTAGTGTGAGTGAGTAAGAGTGTQVQEPPHRQEAEVQVPPEKNEQVAGLQEQLPSGWQGHRPVQERAWQWARRLGHRQP